jgi:transcriptional regulator with XRE-family HTH domain
MKSITVGSEIYRLRTLAGETLDQIAKKCDIAESTVWKVENDMRTRWETVHLVLKIGLKIHPVTEQYKLIQSLWLARRNKVAESKPDDFNRNKLTPHAAKAIKEFRLIVRELDEKQVNKVMQAVRRAAITP